MTSLTPILIITIIILVYCIVRPERCKHLRKEPVRETLHKKYTAYELHREHGCRDCGVMLLEIVELPEGYNKYMPQKKEKDK